MDEQYRTPYTHDALLLDEDTTQDEIREFVERRATDPYVVDDGPVIWNFNNHMVNTTALSEQAAELIHNRYIITFQISGIWGYMVSMLPDRIHEAHVLNYRPYQGRYNTYPNYIEHTDREKDHETMERIDRTLRESGL